MSCVDWKSALRGASFRGVSFWVESDDAEYGRRLVVHEFPNRDAPFTEDMGEKAKHYHVNAYLAGDDVIGLKDDLVTACRKRGPGTLVLPTDGSVTVRCKSCKRSHHLDRMGYIGFSLEFVESGFGLNAAPLELVAALVDVAAGSAISQILTSFWSAYSGVQQVGWVVSSAAGYISAAAGAIDAVRSQVTMQPDAGADVYQTLTALAGDSGDLARGGIDRVGFGQAYMGTSPLSGPNDLGQRFVDAVTGIQTGATSEASALAALWQLVDYGRPDPLPASESRSEVQDAANITAINGIIRRVALGAVAVAAAEADFGDRETAVMWRARVSEAYERELAGVAAGSPLAAALSDVRGKAAVAISQKMASLQPVITVEASAMAPAIVWAYRLTGDARGAGDLIARNRIRHPSYMPTRFASLAAPVDEAGPAVRRARGA